MEKEQSQLGCSANLYHGRTASSRSAMYLSLQTWHDRLINISHVSIITNMAQLPHQCRPWPMTMYVTIYHGTTASSRSAMYQSLQTWHDCLINTSHVLIITTMAQPFHQRRPWENMHECLQPWCWPPHQCHPCRNYNKGATASSTSPMCKPTIMARSPHLHRSCGLDENPRKSTSSIASSMSEMCNPFTTQCLVIKKTRKYMVYQLPISNLWHNLHKIMDTNASYLAYVYCREARQNHRQVMMSLNHYANNKP